MKYGARELVYASPFADALVSNAAFRAWVLGKTKFFDQAHGARLLDREMLAKRSRGTQFWWRSHHNESCRCFGCSGQETDLLAIFETPIGSRFALHIEVKNPRDKFSKPDQATAYGVRATCWLTEGKTPKRVLPHTDAATVLLFSEVNREKYAPHLDHFETLITFEDIERDFPNFGGGVYSNAYC